MGVANHLYALGRQGQDLGALDLVTSVYVLFLVVRGQGIFVHYRHIRESRRFLPYFPRKTASKKGPTEAIQESDAANCEDMTRRKSLLMLAILRKRMTLPSQTWPER